eukprot:scaffold16220_cov51-Attheya_sp.AAC.2
MSRNPPSISRLAVSFSGGGHLLPYHLGVSSALLRKRPATKDNDVVLLSSSSSNFSYSKKEAVTSLPPIQAVAGSSSGAIAAVIQARLPDRIDEFTHRFISDRGKALTILNSMLHEEELSSSHPPPSHTTPTTTTTIVRNKFGDLNLPTLHIGTTRSVNGEFKLFSFPAHKPMLFRTISSSWNTDDIMKCVEASCHIPQSFHPFDIFSRRSLSYPEGDGVLIDGSYYVDGAISCPAPPPTPYDKEDDCFHISVSPISGGKKADDHLERNARISPSDDSFSFLPLDVTLRGQFKVKPSIQNLRALRVSVGAASSEELQYWFEKGLEDGEIFVKDWTKERL